MMKKYGLIGSSLTHSFSKTFFTEYFSNNKIDASYDLIELDSIDQFRKILNKGFSRLNDTVPYKEKVIPYLDQLSKEASSIGAVNVIQFIDGKTIGHNSDAFGFKQSIKPFLTNLHERALILGTGGAAKAVNFVLKEIGITTFHCSRTPDQQKGLFSYGDINENAINKWF
jgi:shikimate dehydrogenase